MLRRRPSGTVPLQLLSAEAQAIGHLLSRDTLLRRPSVVVSKPALLVFRLTSDTGIGEASFTDADAPLPPEPDPLLSPVAAAVPFEPFPVDADE